MSRCARCGRVRAAHFMDWAPPRHGEPCYRFTLRDPWWIRLLARIGTGRL